MKTTHRMWTYDEVRQALNAVNGETRAVGAKIDRTSNAILTIKAHYNMWKNNPKAEPSAIWRKYFAVYNRDHNSDSNNNIATNLRAEVHSASNAEELFNRAESLFEELKNVLAEAVASEVINQITRERENLNNEMAELREFKERAKDTNFASIMSKSLRGALKSL